MYSDIGLEKNEGLAVLSRPPEYFIFYVCKGHQMSISNSFYFLFFRDLICGMKTIFFLVCQFQKLAFCKE